MCQGYHTGGGLSERQPGLGTVKRDGHHKRDAVGELLTMANIAIGATPLLNCEAANADHDGQVPINEILTAVNNALSGCVQNP